MPIFDFKCPQCGWVGEFFLHKPEDDKQFCSLCKVQLERMFTGCRTAIPNRSKPGSFKFDVKENDAHKDMIHHFKRQEEQGGPKSAEEKKDVDYWHSVLKDRL